MSSNELTGLVEHAQPPYGACESSFNMEHPNSQDQTQVEQPTISQNESLQPGTSSDGNGRTLKQNVSEDPGKGTNGDRGSKPQHVCEDKIRRCLQFFLSRERLQLLLRLSLFSPLKWKKEALWISAPHTLVFGIHIAKFVFLTILILIIGRCRTSVSTIEDNRYIALHHILLKNWDNGYETLPYPPAHGKFAVYKVDDLCSGINFAVGQFYNAEVEAVGNFKRTENDSIDVNIHYYDVVENKSKIVQKDCKITPHAGLSNYTNADGQTLYNFNISKDLIANNLRGVLKRVFEVNLTFVLHAVRFDERGSNAICHQIDGNVSFSDYDQDGQLVVKLHTEDSPIKCAKLGLFVEGYHQCDIEASTEKFVKGFAITTAVVDGFTFWLGIFVLICTWRFMKNNYRRIYKPLDKSETNLPWQEYFWNIQWWLTISVAADVVCLIGIYDIPKEENRYDAELGTLDSAVIRLGYGYLLTLFSFLRFLRISHKFSVLFKTVRRSALDVLFFLICVIVLFVGFWLSAYIVLGPYHIKFQSMSSTAETLFSIINGDEIYATFAILQEVYSGDSNEIRLFSRLIVYVYVSLFTVLVFNLLIALFNNAYEAVKESYESEKEARPIVTALRDYVNYKRKIDDDFSRAFRTLMESEGHLDKAEIEMRRILRMYLLPSHYNGDTAVLERRERSLFFFMCNDFEKETHNIQGKDCFTCTAFNGTCECHCCLLSWVFAKCKCKNPENISREGLV